jgi:spermidine synthase
MEERREVICRTQIDSGELQLQRRGKHFELISNGTFLMATHNGASERRLVQSTLNAAGGPRRVLIGGLGVGFSLGAALASTGVEQVTVVEISQEIIEWNRTHLAEFSSNGITDERTRVVNADLTQWLIKTDDCFDAICIDIDNGPTWTVRSENSWLYSLEGLCAVRDHLHDGGAAGFWSAASAPDFQARLAEQFKQVQVVRVPCDRGEPDHIYVATVGKRAATCRQGSTFV